MLALHPFAIAFDQSTKLFEHSPYQGHGIPALVIFRTFKQFCRLIKRYCKKGYYLLTTKDINAGTITYDVCKLGAGITGDELRVEIHHHHSAFQSLKRHQTHVNTAHPLNPARSGVSPPWYPGVAVRSPLPGAMIGTRRTQGVLYYRYSSW